MIDDRATVLRSPTAWVRKRLEFAPFHGADRKAGKCSPMSPRPAAPSKASVTACNKTSASLWPASPCCYVCTAMPPSMTGPSTAECVDVEAHAGARRQSARQPLLGALEIGGKGELFEGRVAFDDGDLHSGGAKHRRFVCGGRSRSRDRKLDRSASRRNACGVWTRTMPSRAHSLPRVFRRSAPSVSPTGSTGAAPSKDLRWRPAGL